MQVKVVSSVVLLTAVAIGCPEACRAETDLEAVRRLTDAKEVAFQDAAEVAERMDVLIRQGEGRSVYQAFGKILKLALDIGTDVPEGPKDETLARRYRFAGLVRKFAQFYGNGADAVALRKRQDALVAAYADSPGLSGSPEASIAAVAASLVGKKANPHVARPAIALVPRPVEVRQSPGTLTVWAFEVSDRIAVCKEDASLPVEGYSLSIARDGITLASASPAGRFYAVQTLKQLAQDMGDRIVFPCVEIRDWPRFGWRGVQLDESRHFFGKGTVKRMLDQMAAVKMNVFHWHLTDNQGWRLPVRKRPDLAKRSSKRECSWNHNNIWDTFEDMDYGPFYYTEKDIREVLSYAAERHIRIVPEVDLPGHSEAILGQYRDLTCAGKGNVFCIGNPESLKLFDDVFDAVVEMFPGDAVHIGCDEVDKGAWKNCSKCQAFMKQQGLKDENALQSWVCAYIAARLAKKGRRIVGWDELAFEGSIPENGIIMEWRDDRHGGAEAVKRGHACVLTPWKSSYFIGPQGLAEDPFRYTGAQWYDPVVTLEQAYRYDPLDKIPAEGRSLVLGGQCCNWTESTANEAELQWKMWPRAFATAENYWSPGEGKDFADFRRRVAVRRADLIRSHVNCAPLE